MIFAGTPPIMQFDGKSFVTTAPDAITTLSPIFTPGRIITLAPIQTLFPIFTGDEIIGRSIMFFEVEIVWFAVKIIICSAIITLSPISIFEIALRCESLPMPELFPIEILCHPSIRT